MIGLLSGTISSTGRNPMIVSVGGVGYLVHTTAGFITKTKLNDRITLHIHTHVREDALDLYGFVSEEDLNLFSQLLTVSGVGPRTALLVMERGAHAVKKAVRESDVDFFTTIPRLGKKNAQKIIIELKNKLGGLKDIDLTGDATGETKQLLDALMSMGFDRREAMEAVRNIAGTEGSIEQKLKRALKLLGTPT